MPFFNWNKASKFSLNEARIRYPEAAAEAERRLRTSNSQARNSPLDGMVFEFLSAKRHELERDEAHLKRTLIADRLYDISFDDAFEYTEKYVKWGISASVGRWRTVFEPGDVIDADLPIPDEIVQYSRNIYLRQNFLLKLAINNVFRHVHESMRNRNQDFPISVGSIPANFGNLGKKLPFHEILAQCDSTQEVYEFIKDTNPHSAAVLARLMRGAGMDPDQPQAPRGPFK